MYINGVFRSVSVAWDYFWKGAKMLSSTKHTALDPKNKQQQQDVCDGFLLVFTWWWCHVMSLSVTTYPFPWGHGLLLLEPIPALHDGDISVFNRVVCLCIYQFRKTRDRIAHRELANTSLNWPARATATGQPCSQVFMCWILPKFSLLSLVSTALPTPALTMSVYTLVTDRWF